MNGFQEDLDLSYLVGRELTYIGFDQFQLYLVLNAEILHSDNRESGILENVKMDSDVRIGITGAWSLITASGTIIDKSKDHSERQSYQIHRLLGLKLLSYVVLTERTLEFRFETGLCLSIIDDSDMYDTLTIEYGKTLIVI